MLTFWHNPRCSKSRQALALVEASGREVSVVRYLDTPPTADEIAAMVDRLGFAHPRDLMRKGEAVYKELKLKDVDAADALLREMADHPILIERPILSDGERAVIGRPPEVVQDLL